MSRLAVSQVRGQPMYDLTGRSGTIHAVEACHGYYTQLSSTTSQILVRRDQQRAARALDCE